MKFIQGNKHTKMAAVDQIVFERDHTTVVCVDGQSYGIGTVDYMGKPLTYDVHIEMYPSANCANEKGYLN